MVGVAAQGPDEEGQDVGVGQDSGFEEGGDGVAGQEPAAGDGDGTSGAQVQGVDGGAEPFGCRRGLFVRLGVGFAVFLVEFFRFAYGAQGDGVGAAGLGELAGQCPGGTRSPDAIRERNEGEQPMRAATSLLVSWAVRISMDRMAESRL